MKIKITTIIRFPRIVRRTANLNSLVEGFVIMSSLGIFWQTPPPSPSSDDVIYEQPLIGMSLFLIVINSIGGGNHEMDAKLASI